jgi:hypothetical protein
MVCPCVGEASSHPTGGAYRSRPIPPPLRAVMGGEGKGPDGPPSGFEHGYEVHHHPAEPVDNHTTGLHGERLRPLMLGRFAADALGLQRAVVNACW